MKDPPVERLLLHKSIEGCVTIEGFGGGSQGGRSLADAHLTDQQKLAVVFQGAALVAHADHLGMSLGDGTVDGAWRGATVTDGGLLRGLEVRPGRTVDLPHQIALKLLQKVFGSDGEVRGRGAARRVARQLHGHWRQGLARVPPDVLVAQVLDAAPFLWQASFGAARLALAAEFGYVENGLVENGLVENSTTEHDIEGGSEVWLVGPGAARCRFLEAAKGDRSRLDALVSSPRARDLWQGYDPDADPHALFEQRHYRRAVAFWQRRRALDRASALCLAKALLHLGRGVQALEVVRRRRDTHAVILRARCQMAIGERRAAHKTLLSLEERCAEEGSLEDAQTVELAEMAVRLYASKAQLDQVRRWIGRVLAVRDHDARLEALIVAAEAAWDLQEFTVMGEYLEQASAAARHPRLASRYLHTEALRRLSLGDARGAADHVERALVCGRRGMSRGQAGRLWSDAAMMRLAADDLPGSARACHHAVRLFLTCEGAPRETLALHNLASLRIRLGRLDGVDETLERSLAENRRHGNARAALLDLELLARFELARGRPAAALSRCKQAESFAGALHSSVGRADVFAVFAARALGWMGRTERARARLGAIVPTDDLKAGRDALDELDPEERPALLALAGRVDDARREAAGSRWSKLYSAIFDGLDADAGGAAGEWALLDTLEPFRAARLVHDLELLSPGSVPAARRRRAAAELRRLGARALAEKLDRGSLEPWRALRRYVETPRDTQTKEPRQAELLRDAGYPEARLVMRHGGAERSLVGGEGGAARAEWAVEGGVVRLEAPFIDTPLEALCALLRQDLPRVRAEAPSNRSGIDPGIDDGIVGRSPALVRAIDRLDKLAPGDLPVLILGDSGTGKELMARRAHRLSHRSSQPFLAVNCAAFSESLIQSELFGHARGAFTGAERDRPGLFEAARGGTVFLDEIGDLPMPIQGLLLRVLQEKEVRRVGDNVTRKVDVRVVAATHRGLDAMVDDGTFRRDLYYRLRVAAVELPSLVDRGNDIERLARHKINRSRGGELSRGALKKIKSYAWPGNVRQLMNVLDVAVALSAGDDIRSEHLDIPARELASEKADDSEEQGDYHALVDRFKRRVLRSALAASDNQSQAARRLGMSRQALSYLVRKLELDVS